jgi:hypothetical protein
MAGRNATIMAYGQSGTGKTHTIGLESIFSSDGKAGIIPRAMSEIFVLAAKSKSEVKISVSFFEIYQERICDLCHSEAGKAGGKRETLEVREDESGQVFVAGLTCEQVSSTGEALSIIKKGNRKRKIRETERNSSSSRSHAIVQVLIEQRHKNGDTTVKSKVSFCDLAGSERWNKEVQMGEERVNELCNINSSLLALAEVVSALSEGSRRHIPYRSSLLTFILRDSLGGNCALSLIVTLSPSSDCFSESVSTLRFATRASSLPNQPVINVSRDVNSLLDYKEREIKRLRGILADLASPSDSNREQAAAIAMREMQELSTESESSQMAQELEEARRALASERLLRQDLERELQRQQHRPHSEATTHETRGSAGGHYHLSRLTSPSLSGSRPSGRDIHASWGRSSYSRPSPMQQAQAKRRSGVSKVSRIEEAILAIRARINTLSASSPNKSASNRTPAASSTPDHQRKHPPAPGILTLESPREPPESSASTPSSFFGRSSLVSANCSSPKSGGGWGRSALAMSNQSEGKGAESHSTSSSHCQPLFGRSSLALLPSKSLSSTISSRPESRGSSARFSRASPRPVSGALGPASMIYILGSTQSSQRASKIANALKVDAGRLSKKGTLLDALV